MSLLSSARRVFNGLRLPRYVQGKSEPNLFSATDRNREVDALNALLNPSVKPEGYGDFFISDSNSVLDLSKLVAKLGQLGSANSSGSQWFHVHVVHGTYYECVMLDSSGSETGGTVLVARPPEHQNPGAGNTATEKIEGVTWTYTYASRTNNADIQRTATATGHLTEVQILEPIFHVNAASDGYSTIFADQPINGTGVTVSGTPLIWMDTNRAARAWVQVG